MPGRPGAEQTLAVPSRSQPFSELVINDATGGAVSQPGRAICAGNVYITPGFAFMIVNWTKLRVRGHHGQHVSVGCSTFAPAG